MSNLLDEPWSIPNGWIWTTAGEVTDVVGGGTPRSDDSLNFDGGTIPWITPADLSGYRAKYISHGGRSLTERGLAKSGARLLPMGTVLFSSRAPIGYVAITANPVATNQGFKSLVPPPELDPEFLYYYLQRARSLAIDLASGTTFLEISGAKTEKLPLVVAPLPEQHRIVEAIESYFTRLDDAVATLERVQRNLKRYRASVLKAAVEGRLVPTEADLARAEGRDYEPASAHLEHILAERRRRWHEAGGRGVYHEPVAPDTTDLPELPEGWCWATWFQIGLSQNGRGFPSKEYREEGVRLLRPGNLHSSGRVDWTAKNTQHMPEKWAGEFPGFLVGPDELVVNLTAQSLADDFLGRICITGPGERCLLNQRIARLTPILVDARFVLWLFKASGFRRFVSSLNTGSLIQHMFTSQLARFVLSLPPAAEQVRMAAEVERHMSLADGIDTDIEHDLGRCARLRQSILKWAFEGKLADQDPSDEPASALLERIRSQTSASRQSASDAHDRPRRRRGSRSSVRAENKP